MSKSTTAGRSVSLASIVVRIAALILAIVVATWISGTIRQSLDIEVAPDSELMLNPMILIGISVYIVLMTIPFVPGAEIGIAMLTAFGPAVAPLVYCATVIALVLAFIIGRLVPERTVISALRALHLNRAATGIERVQAMPPDARLHALMSGGNPRLVQLGTRYRYVALCLAINLPGNFLIGGGGGIALMAGLSRLFSPLYYVITVALAVAPVPFFVFVFAM